MMMDNDLDLNKMSDVNRLKGAKLRRINDNEEFNIIKIHVDYDKNIVEFFLSKDIIAKESDYIIDREKLKNDFICINIIK